MQWPGQGRVRAWLIAPLAALALGGCAFTPPPPGLPPAGGAPIFVIDRGWHTDIGLPVPRSDGTLADVESAFPGARWLVFGFGERVYYTDAHPTLGTALRALFPSRAAILVTALRHPPAEAFGGRNVVVLRLSAGAAARIARFIEADLARGGAGRPRPILAGPYPGSLFYAARGSYDALHTCNTWTAEALASGGVPIRAFGTLFASQVMDQVREAEAHSPEHTDR
jgi:uncharacterized protein (TIGR02117 family)